MTQGLEQRTTFLALSEALAGFSRFDLPGTNAADELLEMLPDVLPAGVADKLLAAAAPLAADSSGIQPTGAVDSSAARAIFKKAGIRDYTGFIEAWFPTVQHDPITFHYHGMGHFSGTHAMGDAPANTVVDSFQRSRYHNNLFLIGSGGFATMDTSNSTLTLAALHTAEHPAEELHAKPESGRTA